MTDIKLHEGELNIMELLWSNKSLAAKDIAKIIKDYIGWKKILLIRLLSGWLRRGRFAGMNLALFAGLRFQRRPSSFLKQSIF